MAIPQFVAGVPLSAAELNVLVDEIESPAAAAVVAAEAKSGTTYTDLATVGPAVTLVTGTDVVVTLSTLFNSAAAGTGFVGVAVSGATTIAAPAGTAPLTCFDSVATDSCDYSRELLITGLTPGTNTFTCKYRMNTSTGTWSARVISVRNLA